MRKRDTVRRIICILIYGAVFIAVLVFLNRLLCIKDEHGIRQASELYVQPEDSIDVAFMGSSHVHYDVNTAYLWEQFGIAGYDYSAAEQPLWITYHYLQELCKTQSPSLIVLDMFAPSAFKDDYQYNYLTDNLNGMRFSVNKLRMLSVSCEPDRLWEFWPSISTYHMRYRELTEEDWKPFGRTRYDRMAYKGFFPHYDIDPHEAPQGDRRSADGLTAKSREYLMKIIYYAKEKDIDLFLIVSPYNPDWEDVEVYRQTRDIAMFNGIRFEDYNDLAADIGIDYARDFNDDSHLNYDGSIRFSDYLGRNICDYYDIPDRRGDEYWESWDRHAELVREEAEEKCP